MTSDKREYLILAAFVLLPVTILTSGLIHDGHRIAFFTLSLGVLAVYVRNPWLMGLMFWAMAWQITILILTFTMLQKPPVIYTATDQYIYYLCAGLAFVAVKYSKIPNEHWYNAICTVTIFQMVIGACQFFKLDPYTVFLNYFVMTVSLWDGINGTLGNPNFHCAFLAISLPFFFRDKWKWFIPAIAFFLIYSHTSTSVVAACAAVAVFFWHWTWVVAAGLMACVYAFWYDGNIMGNERFGYWRSALENMAIWPISYLTGMGPGVGFRHEWPLHNEWMTIFYRYGAVGLACAVGYVFTAYRDNRILFAALVAASVNAIGNYPLHLAPSVFLLMIVMGLMEREKEQCEVLK